MDSEADPLIQMGERKDGSKRKPDVEDGLYYSGDGPRKNSQGEAPVEPKKGWFKRNIHNMLNMFTFCLAAPGILQAAYAVDQGERWYGNILLPWALICYVFGTLMGVVLKFTEGKLLSTYFPKKFAARKISYQEFQEIGAAGYWHKWMMILATCVYVELTASTAGRLYGLNPILVERFPEARALSISLTTLEPATVLVILLAAVMVLPMWHKTRFDTTWFGLSPLFIGNNFPWGFPIYRVLVGLFSNFFKLVECHKEHTQAKAAAQRELSS